MDTSRHELLPYNILFSSSSIAHEQLEKNYPKHLKKYAPPEIRLY